jgi:hypothetical protein
MDSDEIGKSFYLQSNGSVTLFALSLAGGAIFAISEHDPQ